MTSAGHLVEVVVGVDDVEHGGCLQYFDCCVEATLAFGCVQGLGFSNIVLVLEGGQSEVIPKSDVPKVDDRLEAIPFPADLHGRACVGCHGAGTEEAAGTDWPLAVIRRPLTACGMSCVSTSPLRRFSRDCNCSPSWHTY